MPNPKDFLPAKPPFIPIPSAIIKRGLNEYSERPVKVAKKSPEDRLLDAIFGKKRTVLMVKCRGCGEWLEDENATYLNNMAYHSACAARVIGL